MSYDNLKKIMHMVTDLGQAAAVLGWDQETYMPDGAVVGRSEQMATLSALIHNFMTNDAAKAAVAAVKSNLDSMPERERRVVEVFIRDHDRAVQLPVELVEEQTRVASLAQDAWKRAKNASDFSIFAPLLQRTVELKRQEVALLGASEHPYDLLLDLYEPGLTVDTITPIFDRLRVGTTALLAKIQPHLAQANDDVLHRTYPKNEQLDFAREVVQALGFDMHVGRVDLSAHPFCTSFGATDVRLTTRIRENDLRSCLFGLIHEAGHGMYEQGIGKDLARTLSAQGASMGIHESQSLFWENVIARSETFWVWAFPRLHAAFPTQLADQTATSFFKAINKMSPSLNRVESDELTYNLHIILRFEIERDLIAGVIEVTDIPRIWNEKMQASLGITPANDAEGCLQDVHWSFGGIGYFPSYTLGKLYAAMEWNALKVAMPDVTEQIARGNFAPIKEWLRENIHQVGRTELPSEIIKRVTGRDLTEVDFLDYVGARAAIVYGF